MEDSMCQGLLNFLSGMLQNLTKVMLLNFATDLEIGLDRTSVTTRTLTFLKQISTSDDVLLCIVCDQ